ncbi:hypothetical protein E2C01_055821 [Portunus trituberculatus]|uniref:Uncharacterized protein n=1 Tax=Portunus trituberculatus TaxID=210409 RepID=A0A5B7GWJ9_PORTR|nr:hypothetical protein [Portunus trituberculatus]
MWQLHSYSRWKEPEHQSAIIQLPSIPATFTFWSATEPESALSPGQAPTPVVACSMGGEGRTSPESSKVEVLAKV